MPCYPQCNYEYDYSCGIEYWTCNTCGDELEQPNDCPGGR